MASDDEQSRGGDEPRKRKRRKGVLPLLLGLLVVAGVVVALVLVLGGDEETPQEAEQPGRSPGRVAQVETTPFDGGGSQPDAADDGLVAAQGARGASAANPSSPGEQPGTLSAGGRALSGTADLSDRAKQEASGREVEIQSLVSDRGFWVGNSSQDRVYVELELDTETAQDPTEGDRIDLTGRVRPAPEDPEETLGLNARDAEQLREQGAYVNATKIEIVGR